MFSSYFSSEDCLSLSAPSRADVQSVYDKFHELHRSLHRRMRDLNWDLHPHWNRSEIINSYSMAAAAPFEGLAMPFTRSREQAVLVERLMGRDSFGPLGQVDLHRHPVIEVRLTQQHFAVELVVPGGSWLDQQNLIGKLEVPRHRQALKTLIQGLPGDTVIGFWKGVEIDDIHVTTAQLSRGSLLEQWIGTFQDGHDYLRVGAWYEPQDTALNASSILSEVSRRVGALYNVYNFLLWTSNNDFRTFYGKGISAYSSRDMRLS
jgi:hypothetical protein